LAVDEARSNRIVTFVTNAELCKIQDLAHAEQQSISSACHQLICRSLAAPGEPPSTGNTKSKKRLISRERTK